MTVTARRLRLFWAEWMIAWSRLAPNTRGALFMICAAISAVLMFTTVKLLGDRIASHEIVFFRAVVGVVIAVPVLMRRGGRGFRTGHLPLQLSTGVLGALALIGTFFALAHMELADVTVVMFTRPMFLLLLAMLFLGETMRAGRWLATLSGFIGVLVIVKPAGIVEVAALAVIGSALLTAIMVVFIKKMAMADGPDIQLFYFNLTMAVVLITPTLLWWTTPSLADFLLLLLVGVLGAVNAAFIVFSLRVGEATVVSPFDYTRLIFAAGIGFLLFREIPDGWFWLGSVMIVAANIYIVRARPTVKPGAAP
ncbi:MAG: DMT family transporter [Proteobacteria bacterium]|nr:DMT family transporter [Pseudomonadota bacterium]